MKTRLQLHVDTKGSRGFVVQGYDAPTATYVMEDVLLTSERWVANKVELVPGKGVPAFTSLTLRTMKLFAIPAGSLRRLQVWGNHHVESVLQLAHAERQGLPLDEAVRGTRAYQSIETPMVQSGHRIAGVTVHGGRRKKCPDPIAARSTLPSSQRGKSPPPTSCCSTTSSTSPSRPIARNCRRPVHAILTWSADRR